MDNVINLINHLLNTKHSIDTVDSIIDRLQISKGYLLQLLDDYSYKDYFQLLRPASNRNQATEKIALTLDLFCCTHYANQCKNESCPFLHLCPYNIRPMHPKCTNKTCPYDHEVLKSIHNRKIIDVHGLAFMPASILHELTRASADPLRSFWVCTDHGKKGGCSKKYSCEKFHYCYFALIDGCTKPYCQHAINDACLSYFRKKELIEQNHDDILDAFRKVLRQRKPVANQQRGAAASSTRSMPSVSAKELAPFDQIFSSKSDTPEPLPEHDTDILLLECHDTNEYDDIEHYLSNELECPIKLIMSKNILSESKEKLSSNLRTQPIYYYCPTKKPADIFRLLRWQNTEKKPTEPLIVYANVRDAHDAAEQNFENNQFCIFRIHIFYDDITNESVSSGFCLRLSDPSTMCFDRMWVYVYNL
ncbi:unnamed protein product [Rotaria socialis]|uniref:Uncharacterized protein n=1 Tax=Rotaria socialis TaxID=392032 RepID=A0A817RFS6_9BILA|nr:unnamed protein product [Rotaria socialis]CAF3448226.1 unnamed protein product [Rotaria socialis]CAF3458450.1 unnamed protein product [Rotaria socialis]CAF3563227.1 unnamed protein product [Rotaria socialis]CAF3749841.1 unnamed protein product [Rotaria socialis]